MSIQQIDEIDKNLDEFNTIPLDVLSNYLLSINGIIFNKNTNKFKICEFYQKDKCYAIKLNNKRYQLKYLFYITFIDATAINVDTKNFIIKTPPNPNKYINFSVDDISIKTKKSKLESTKKSKLESTKKSELKFANYPELDEFTTIPVESFENYLISKCGLFYNKKTKNYLTPTYHSNTHLYIIKINKIQYQVKHLLYITYVNPEYDFNELKNVKSKFMINIKKTNNDLPYINFEVDDLELITKSDKNRAQGRFNRIINKYNNQKVFIQSYDNTADICKEFGIKHNKFITLACGKNKNKLYRNYYFRYNDNDEIKNPNIIGSFDEMNINEESKQEIELKSEEWKQLSSNDDNDEYYKIYEISNHGRFKNRNTKKILKLQNQNGYLHANINIYNPEKNKKVVKKIRVNILVAKYFLTIPEQYLDKYNPDELVVDHIDKNKENNYFENLQYLSNSENVKRG